MHHFALPAIWGLLGYCSWIGWGIILGYWIDPGCRFDAGLCAGWGMSLVLGVGGILNATFCCGWAATIVLVAGGNALLIRHLFVQRRSLLATPLGRWQVVYLPFVAAAILVYGASVCWWTDWSAIDDYPAYLVYPLKMLHAGAAIEPFSMRRLSTFGGYSFLQTVVSPFAWPTSRLLLDIGLGAIGTSLSVIGFLRSRSTTPLLCALAGIAVLQFPIPRLNSMCTMLILFGVITLFRTLLIYEDSPSTSRRRVLVIAALTAAGLISFRPVLIPSIGLSVILYMALGYCSTKIGSGMTLLECALFLALVSLIIAPWSLSLYFSSESPLWPTIPGNYNRQINFTDAHLPFGAVIWFLIDMFVQPPTILALATGFLIFLRFRPLPLAMLLAAAVTIIMAVKSFTLSDTEDLSRYTMPMTLSAGLAMILAAQSTSRPAARKTAEVCLIVASLLLITADATGTAFADDLSSWQHGVIGGETKIRPLAPAYRTAQSHVPADATILNLTELPFLFDYSRKTIYGMDWPGMASPPPGLPLGKGPQALLNYLRSQSIDYLICNDFDVIDHMAISSRPFMELRMAADPRLDPRVPTDQRIMPTCLQAMNDVNELELIDPPIYKGDDLFVIQIKSKMKPSGSH